ncbi:DDE-type integrase/transposase/recombinase [Candidatus Pacearchaeota archaeon]|nr:DDE-type integrase/transposase/recombinase [Candidatus Pacearchaeota archaeon]
MTKIVKPKINGNIHYDEKYIKVNGKDNYDLNAIDSKTKFVLAHLFVEKRTKQKCYEFLKQIKDNCYKQIWEIYEKEKHKKVGGRELIKFVCDKFANYKSAFNRLFYRTCKLAFGVPIACKKYNLEHNNNPIERYNGKTKDRMNGMRKGFSSFDGAKDFMNLRRVINNFVNPHQELEGKTPAEVAEINLKLGRNKLLGLARYLANKGNDD